MPSLLSPGPAGWLMAGSGPSEARPRHLARMMIILRIIMIIIITIEVEVRTLVIVVLIVLAELGRAAPGSEGRVKQQ